jgi:hypothetical protein
MALTAKSKHRKAKQPSEQPQAKVHVARLVGLTDLGFQPGFEYQGKEIDPADKITFTYELVNHFMEDGRPFWVSEDVTVNDFEGDGISSKMMLRVRVLDPENDTQDGKDLTKMLGNPCMVKISHNDRGYAQLKGQGAVSGAPEGFPIPELKNEIFHFSMDDPDMDLFESFSSFQKDKILAALDLNETELGRKVAESW